MKERFLFAKGRVYRYTSLMAKDLSKESKNTSWGGVSDWYDELLEGGEDTYQREVIMPNILRLLSPQKGKTILDLACGQGFFSRELAKAGASVIGVDISSELIALAKEKRGGVEYHVSSAENLSFLKDECVDAVVSVLAVQNFKNIAPVFKEACRVLRKGGTFVMVLNHPAFRIPKGSSWGFDEEKNIQYRRVDGYLGEREIPIDMNPSEKGRKETLSFHRPLQVYSKVLANAGFVIKRIEEWTSHKKSEEGPRKIAEDRARKEIPIFMMIEVIKFS